MKAKMKEVNSVSRKKYESASRIVLVGGSECVTNGFKASPTL